jgi:hypothetical protein
MLVVLTWTGCKDERYFTASVYTGGSFAYSSDIWVRVAAKDVFSWSSAVHSASAVTVVGV